MAQMVKHLPTMRETWVQSLGQEDLLEKEMETHSSILAWKIPWMEESGRLLSMGLQRVWHHWATSLTHFKVQLIYNVLVLGVQQSDSDIYRQIVITFLWRKFYSLWSVNYQNISMF